MMRVTKRNKLRNNLSHKNRNYGGTAAKSPLVLAYKSSVIKTKDLHVKLVKKIADSILEKNGKVNAISNKTEDKLQKEKKGQQNKLVKELKKYFAGDFQHAGGQMQVVCDRIKDDLTFMSTYKKEFEALIADFRSQLTENELFEELIETINDIFEKESANIQGELDKIDKELHEKKNAEVANNRQAKRVVTNAPAKNTRMVELNTLRDIQNIGKSRQQVVTASSKLDEELRRLNEETPLMELPEDKIDTLRKKVFDDVMKLSEDQMEEVMELIRKSPSSSKIVDGEFNLNDLDMETLKKIRKYIDSLNETTNQRKREKLQRDEMLKNRVSLFENEQNDSDLSSLFSVGSSQQLADVSQQVADVSQKVADVPQQIADVSQQVADVSQQVADVPQQLDNLSQKIDEIDKKINAVAAAAATNKSKENVVDVFEDDNDVAPVPDDLWKSDSSNTKRLKEGENMKLILANRAKKKAEAEAEARKKKEAEAKAKALKEKGESDEDDDEEVDMFGGRNQKSKRRQKRNAKKTKRKYN